MERTALDAVRRVQSTAERAKNAAKRNPITSGTIALGAAGGLWFASQLLGSQSRTGPGSEMLYTEVSCDDKTLDQVLKEVEEFDARDVDAPESQTHFEALMDNWTKAAALYSKAGDCDKAHYALGRLCYEGRGYVYDPEYGLKLYEKAALKGNKDAMHALACIALDSAHQGYAYQYNESELSELARFVGNQKTQALYEAACLLRRAHGPQKALDTLRQVKVKLYLKPPERMPDDIKKWTSTWAKDTHEHLKKTAISNSAAKGPALIQQWLIANDQALLRLHGWQPSFNAGWREGVAALILAKWDRRVATEGVKRLLESALASQDAHQMKTTASVVLNYCDYPGKDPGCPEFIQRAKELMGKAAAQGDAVASITRLEMLGKDIWAGGPDRDSQDDIRMRDMKAEKELLVGRRGASREHLFQLGRELEFTRDKNLAEAEAYRRAAELGHWNATSAYRRRLSSNKHIDPDIPLFQKRLLVVPIPADLVHLANEHTTEAPRAQWIRPTMDWSEMGITKLTTDDARAKMTERFDTTFAGAPEGEVVVILEPMDTSFFGKHESSRYDLTASAIVSAKKRREREDLYVAMCVFDDLSVVALYDEAFALHAL
jgi:TPR repeat protein